ncbi:hypothetical protein LTS15_007716 [Exophiala xenobiotica]|nr:hypothetical protein LTS15_007716 [Exophiala xenobiotica]
MVISFRSPDVERYRVILLLARGLSGFVFGFANINNLGILLDVFGASLQSSKSHDGLANPYDVRRHGGGMGVWLAIWSWCTTGSIALGFVIGAFIISGAAVDWGFWVSLTLLMGVLLLNVIAPEVRRSAFRRTIAEIIGEGGSFSRVARGEVKLHLTGNGPYWWGEEVKAGLQLSWKMVKQPGFLILSIYAAWAYAQFTLILMLLGALTSTLYRYRPVDVGLCVLSLVIGSALAIPFQKASWFSRARYYPPRTNSMTLQKALPWTSHTIRRALVMVFLPLAAIAYALTSRGPSFPVAVPCVFAGCVAWASALAIGECYALMMQTFDVSDLQPGMTGRPVRKSVVMRYREQRTNFSSYPRVSAGIAVTQSLKFVFGAVSVGICGRVERRYGAMQAAFIVSGVLLTLTLLLTAVLCPGGRRPKQMVGDSEKEQIDRRLRICSRLSILQPFCLNAAAAEQGLEWLSFMALDTISPTIPFPTELLSKKWLCGVSELKAKLRRSEMGLIMAEKATVLNQHLQDKPTEVAQGQPPLLAQISAVARISRGYESDGYE